MINTVGIVEDAGGPHRKIRICRITPLNWPCSAGVARGPDKDYVRALGEAGHASWFVQQKQLFGSKHGHRDPLGLAAYRSSIGFDNRHDRWSTTRNGAPSMGSLFST